MNLAAALLLIICLFAAVFLKVSWLIVGFLLIIILFVFLGTSSGTPAKSRAGSGGKEVEILHPVVYEDLGGPAMYPESVQIVHRQGALGHREHYQKLGMGVGVVSGAIGRGIRKIFGGD